MHAELFTLPTFRQSNPDWKRIADVRTTIVLEQLDKQSELHLLAHSSELNQPQRKASQSLAAIARRVQELPSPSELFMLLGKVKQLFHNNSSSPAIAVHGRDKITAKLISREQTGKIWLSTFAEDIFPSTNKSRLSSQEYCRERLSLRRDTRVKAGSA